MMQLRSASATIILLASAAIAAAAPAAGLKGGALQKKAKVTLAAARLTALKARPNP